MKPPTISGFVLVLAVASGNWAQAELKAGAARIDVTPRQFPVLINGGMTSRSAERSVAKIHARAIVLDDLRERLAIVVVDSCMMPRPLLDEAKQLISQRTKIRTDRITISATHTHTAPASMGCLGTDADQTYIPYLREKLAEAVAAAAGNLEPARVGWAVKNAAEYTALRRWIIRPDRIIADPFGNLTVRANMHAGANWDNVTGESGPEDPDLSMISLQSTTGRPIALLANFSMHYFSGVDPVHPDYFGLFCDTLESHLNPQSSDHPPLVALMSHGCSGDIWRRDYTKPADQQNQALTIDDYTKGLTAIARETYDSITYRDDADLAMAERRLELRYRVPDQQRLQWAQQVVAAMGDRLPKTTDEVYAREQIILHQLQSTQVVVQAIRIGEIAIATSPCETYALTGLKLKLQSPLARTMVIELANGGDGYIPPPEQHLLGGYNTWPARSAGLEVTAESRITATALELLEQVAGRPRRDYQQSRGAAADELLAARPAAYWRLDEFSPPRARDISGHNRDAIYEPGVVFFLAGPQSDQFCRDGETNRAAHFAGGRLEARVPGLSNHYSVSLWFWNGMPADGRATSGWIFSRGPNHGANEGSEHIGVGGTASQPGKLIYQQGPDRDDRKPVAGRSTIERWTWNHLTFVRDGDQVRFYLNDNREPEVDVCIPIDPDRQSDQMFFGGRTDNQSNWEGRLDEIAVFDRVLRARGIGVGR